MATTKQHKAAEMQRISQIGDFKQRMGGVFELPSGFTVRLKNPGGLKAFMTGGTIPNALMTTVQTSLDKGQAPSVDAFMKDGQIDDSMMSDMMLMMDRVAMTCIVEPRFLPMPSEEDVALYNKTHKTKISDPNQLRRDDQLYIDELPDDDKQFIFGWMTGGVKDLATFRQQRQIDMGTVAPVTESVGAAQRAARIDPR